MRTDLFPAFGRHHHLGLLERTIRHQSKAALLQAHGVLVDFDLDWLDFFRLELEAHFQFSVTGGSPDHGSIPTGSLGLFERQG